MKKGIDYPAINVVFFCHDGQGNYLFHKRSLQCRDEQGHWDCGGGSLEFGEKLLEAVDREVSEEFNTKPLETEFLGVGEVFREQDGLKTHWIAFRYRVLVNRDLVVNNEPDRHEELGWFRIDNPPSPLHSQIPGELLLYKEMLI